MSETEDALAKLRANAARIDEQLKDLLPQLSVAQKEVAELVPKWQSLQSELAGLSAARIAASEQLGQITKRQLSEIKQMTRSPPDSIRRTLVAAWVLLHSERFKGRTSVPFDEAKDWQRCQKMLADDGFIARILNFDASVFDSVPHVPRHVASHFFGISVTGKGVRVPNAPASSSTTETPPDSNAPQQGGSPESDVTPPQLELQRRHTEPARRNASRLDPKVAPLELDAVTRASAPCGALFQWMLELVRESVERYRIKEELLAVEPPLQDAEGRSNQLEMDVAGAEEALARARNSIEELERCLAQLRREQQDAEAAVRNIKKLETLQTGILKSSPAPRAPRPRPKEEKVPQEVVVETSGSMAHIEHELAQLRVRFGKGAARVLAGDADQALVLPKIADIVRSHKGGLKVLLEGHRDDDEGQGVDVERALSVMEWLLDGALCPAAGLRVKGHGSSRGEGRCVVPVPIDELVVTSGPLSAELAALPGAPKPGIFFDASASAITAETKSILEKISVWLRGEDDTPVRIEGHTDPGELADLARKRADAVCQALVSLGVAASQLRTQSCAGRHPTSRLHEAMNRRVEIHLE